MKKIIISALIAFFSMSVTAQAGIIANYKVSNYNAGTAKHGLYTFGDFVPQEFTIDAIFTIFENNGVKTATLDGTLTNASHSGTINLDLDNWQDTFNYKVEGGANNGGVNADYFVGISGEISIDGNPLLIANCVACGYAFQYGIGANAKNPTELGASAWIQHENQTGTQHWDLNLSFTDSPVPPTSVPEPGVLILISLGLFGLVLNTRRRQISY